MRNYRLDDFRKNPIYALRRKNTYYKYYGFVEKAFQWSAEEINEWQWKHVKGIVDYAFKHVPYYQSRYKEEGLEAGDIKTWEDFEKLPSITKSDIKEHLQEFYSDEILSLPYREDHTRGSTGQAMHFFIDDDLFYREDAVYRYYWNSTGFGVGNRCVILRGHKLIGNDMRFRCKYNPSWNYLMLDSRYICPELLAEYDAVLKRFKAPNIQAYPSSLALLAETYLESEISPPRFKRIYFGSENVYENQKELIKRVFYPDLMINQYGHTERVLLALQNVDEGGMGFVPFYGYMELLRPDMDVAIHQSGELGEITGTGFSKCMPFIRYRTNDFSEFSTAKYKKTMAGWKRIESLEGRLQEFVVTSDKRLVSICTIGGAHIPEMSLLYDMQYYQDRVGDIIIKAKRFPGRDITQSDISSIERKLESVLDNKINCKVVLTDHIERTDRNKKMMLIQKLNIRDYMGR